MPGKPIVIAIAADTAEFKTKMASAEGDISGLADTAAREGNRVQGAFDTIGEGADGVASASSQAAGGLGDLGGALSLMPGPLGALGAGMEATAPAIMGLTGASDLLNLATTKFPGLAKVASAGAKGLGIAMRFATGPVGLIIIGITALIAVVVLAYKKVGWFRDLVNGAFGLIKKVAGGAIDWVKNNWGKILIFLTGPIGLAATQIAKHWDDITTGAKNVWTYIKGLPGKISNAFSNIWHGLAGGLESAINNLLHLPLTIPTIDTHIPGIGKVGGQVLIPALATGGIVTGPTLALIGEAGPEAVVPLSRYNGLGGDLNLNLNIHLTADQVTQLQRGREISADLTAYRKAGGR